ncbi:MAG: hypothetical protein LBH06_03305 [Rikenellaceae bacterium]|jgi:hypothetical protein|nr:hypothetical protein [Rikenellaceae bacterium]
MKTPDERKLLRYIRLIVLFYITMLVFWGATAFPLQWGVGVACRLLGVAPDADGGLAGWLTTVWRGVTTAGGQFPFLFYGTDWLAFSHLVIAVAFIGVYTKPVRNVWVVYFGMTACAGIIPLALICGPLRGIPLFWQLIDCSFGVFGVVPLIALRRLILRLEAISGRQTYKY